jgi:hypothetical protein
VAELNDSLKQTDELLSSIVKSLTSAEQITKRLEGSMGGVAGKAKSAKGGGDRHIGSGMGSQMPHMGKATFGGHETASNTAEVAMREGMEATRYGLTPTRGAKVLGVGQGLAQATFGIAAGVMAAVPGVAEVGTSAANYYGASLTSRMGRRAIMNATFSGLAGGVTSTLSASNIAGIAASRGITPGSAQYNALVADVGGAARTMNMANENAMVAMSGFTQGDFSSRLYNLGVSTYDSKTGKARGKEEIFGQLYSRLTQGQGKMTGEETNTSFQAGGFGKLTTDLGMSEDQKELFRLYAYNRAEGKPTDLSKLGYGQNTQADKMRITTSDTSVLNAYTDPVLAGFKSAADLIVNTVNPALENMASVAGKASGFLGGMGESRAGAGIGIAVGGILAGVQTIIAMMAGGAVMSAAGGAVAGGAAAGGAMAAGAAGAGVVVAAGGLGYLTGKGGKALGNKLGVSQGVTRAGSVAASAGTGALVGAGIGSVVPVLGTGVGAVIGGLIGGIGGFFGSGGGTPGFGASFGSMGGGSASPSSPITNGGVGTPYGATGNLWSGGSHTGQDYPCAVGTPVHASLGGVVINTSPGSDYGKTVEIDHGNGYQTLYGHLSEVLVKVGETVTQGQLIAKSGETGKVTGPHLHYEVRKGKNNPVNPEELGKAGGSGLAGVLGASGNNATSTNGQQLSSMVGSKSLQDLLSGGIGNLPAELLGSASSSSGSGGSKVILGTGSEKEWATGLLQKMGAPVNDASVNALTTWMRHEGGHWKNSANYNPLNTTLDMSNNESMNSVGVKRYKSWEEGYAATIGTLTGKNAGDRGYTAIVDALKSGASTDSILGAINNSAWMTGKTGKNPYKFQGGGSPSVATLSSSSGINVSPSITINVSVQQASYAEAMNLVEIVKTQLEKENLLRLVGGK